jgi:hypothetical protein
MFMILGPNGPFTNLPPTIETQVEWIAEAIRHVSGTDAGWLDVKPDVETACLVIRSSLALVRSLSRPRTARRERAEIASGQRSRSA